MFVTGFHYFYHKVINYGYMNKSINQQNKEEDVKRRNFGTDYVKITALAITVIVMILLLIGVFSSGAF